MRKKPMNTAGYSGTPLVKKLGIKASSKIAIVDAPEDYDNTLGELPENVKVIRRAAETGLDLIQFFVKDRARLDNQFAKLASRLQPAGALWISWPKKSSGVETDVDEGTVREIGLKAGLVDIKICAVDETWSGLKFVVRVRDRP